MTKLSDKKRNRISQAVTIFDFLNYFFPVQVYIWNNFTFG